MSMNLVLASLVTLEDEDYPNEFPLDQTPTKVTYQILEDGGEDSLATMELYLKWVEETSNKVAQWTFEEHSAFEAMDADEFFAEDKRDTEKKLQRTRKAILSWMEHNPEHEWTLC